MVYTLYMVSGVFPAWNAQPRRTDQRFFHVTPWSAMERLSWNAVNVAYRVEKKSGNTPACYILSIIFKSNVFATFQKNIEKNLTLI